MNMRANFPDLPGTDADIMPSVSMAEIQSGLAETGIMVEHIFSMGLIATWLILPDQFEECLCNSRDLPQILAALEVPKDYDSAQLAFWLQEQSKFGWLIRADVLVRTPHYAPPGRAAGGWFYDDRLDLALVEAIRWVKGGAA